MARVLAAALALAAAARAADPTETYGSLLYAPKGSQGWREKKLELACVQAVAGHELARMDPGRDRVAIVNDRVPRKLVEVLATSWRVTVVDMRRPDPSGQNRAFRWPKWEQAWKGPMPDWAVEQDLKQLPLDNAEMLGRKSFAWNMTRPDGRLYERVMFFDADILFLNSDETRRGLEGLWGMPRGRLWAYESGKVHSCLSGGFLLLEPNRTTFDLMQRCLWEPEVLPRLAVCPGHDQRILNSVFAGRWSSLDEVGALKKEAAKATSASMIHFHHRRASKWVSATWKRLMSDVPEVVRKTCAGVY